MHKYLTNFVLALPPSAELAGHSAIKNKRRNKKLRKKREDRQAARRVPDPARVQPGRRRRQGQRRVCVGGRRREDVKTTASREPANFEAGEQGGWTVGPVVKCIEIESLPFGIRAHPGHPQPEGPRPQWRPRGNVSGANLSPCQGIRATFRCIISKP